jgi:hypothetical protein
VVFAAAAIVAILLPSLAAAETPVACTLLSPSQIKSTLSFQHSVSLRETSSLEGTGSLEPAELPDAVHTECDQAAWTGSTPKSRAGVYKKARTGKGAQVGVETWAPNFDGPNGETWVKEGYEELLNNFQKARFGLYYKFPGRFSPLSPAGEGYSGTGIAIKGSGPAQGLLGALGCWWNVSNHRAVCVFDEEAKSKPVVADLNSFASIVVPNFLG